MEALAAAIEASWPAAALRQSRWVYPAINTAHVFGIALLFGAIVPMDLRLLGVWRRDVPLAVVVRLLKPVAATGAALAVATGLMLFSVQAGDYAALPLFGVKLALVAAGLGHALLAGRGLAGAPRRQRQRAGAVSLAVWISVVICGRLLGYL